MKRFVLAYSGGLDTSVILKWLQVTHDAEVVTVTADFGQRFELDGIQEKALTTGASLAFVEDLRDEFVRDYFGRRSRPVRCIKTSTRWQRLLVARSLRAA